MVEGRPYSRPREIETTFEMDPPIPGYSVYVEVKRPLHSPDVTEIAVSWHGAERVEHRFWADRQEPHSVMWKLNWDEASETGSIIIEAREFHEFARYAFNRSESIRNKRNQGEG